MNRRIKDLDEKIVAMQEQYRRYSRDRAMRAELAVLQEQRKEACAQIGKKR